MPSVFLVDILQDFLAALVLEVDVDIRRFIALHADEAFEQQAHPHRVDGRNLQRVAHRGIGCRSSPLAQNAALSGEPNDVPDRQKISWEIELLDQLQLPLYLKSDVRGNSIRVAHRQPLLGQFSQVADRAVAGRKVLLRKMVAKLLQAEVAGIGDFESAAHGLGKIDEQLRHFPRTLDRSFSVPEELLARRSQGRLVPNRGQHILQWLPLSGVGGHIVVSADREPQLLRQLRSTGVAGFVSRAEQTGDPHVKAAGKSFSDRRDAPVLEGKRQQRAQPSGMLRQLPPRQAGLPLGVAQPALRDQLTKVSITLQVLDVDHHLRPVRQRQPTSNDQPEVEGLGSQVRLHHPVETVSIGERERGKALLGCGMDQFFGMGSPPKEGKVGSAHQLRVHKAKLLNLCIAIKPDSEAT